MRKFSSFSFAVVFFIACSLSFPSAAFARKKSTIVLRATGSGAAVGAAAGLISYPFAKSAGTIVAGAFVGAVLGTAYGFHLADEAEQRERAQRQASFEGCGRDPAILAREWQTRRNLLSQTGASPWVLPLSFDF